MLFTILLVFLLTPFISFENVPLSAAFSSNGSVSTITQITANSNIQSNKNPNFSASHFGGADSGSLASEDSNFVQRYHFPEKSGRIATVSEPGQ